MTNARQVLSLLKSHFEQDDTRFYAAAMQVAAAEARAGHTRVANEIRELIDRAKALSPANARGEAPIPIAKPRGELAHVLTLNYPDVRLADMVLSPSLAAMLKRVLTEQKRREQLLTFGLSPRRKLLLVGPPGAGKTMTASALAGELHIPLFTVVLEQLISKFMGDTASKLRLVFDAMKETRGVYFFDEFDAIGAKRNDRQDVGEIRRVLNSFLQMLEEDNSAGLIVCATNHVEILDRALFRRFDDVVRYSHPTVSVAERLLRAQLAAFKTTRFSWSKMATLTEGLSHAEIVLAARDAAKASVLSNSSTVTAGMLKEAIQERRRTLLE